MEDEALDKIAKEIIANEAGIKSFDQLINEFETDMLKGLSQADAENFSNWYLDNGYDKEGKARAWLNENTDRLSDPAMIDDDTSFAMEQQGFDEVAETNKAFELEQQQIDDAINNISDDIVIDTPTNVVDDIAKQNELINNFVNSMKTEGNLEFYVKHSGTEVPASSIQYNPRIGRGSQIPGFYTEPLGIRDIKTMGGTGGPNAISNYYKVQVNSNNLLISAGGGKVTGLNSPISNVGNANLGNQIEKIDWKIFEQETGLSWENDFNGKGLFSVERGEKVLSSDSQGFIRRLRGMGLTDDQISSALRKSGIEGFVSGPTNAQYEIVLLDPNDELGIGKNINVQDATETDFVNNQSKVNQIDELITDTPTNVVDNVEKIMANIPENIPDVPKQSLKKVLSSRLKKTLVGGIDALDMYELGLIGMALVEPAVQKALNPIMPMIVPGFKGKLDSKTYGQQVIENLQTTAKISPTAKAAEKFAEMPDQGEYNSYSWVGKMLDR